MDTRDPQPADPPASAGEPTLVAERYELVAAADDVGLGEVWRAKDTRFRGRLVALKLLRAVEGAALPEALATRFKSLRTLRHDQCLPLVNFGLHERRPFVVYEHFEGRSLGARLDALRARKVTPPLPWVRAVFDGVLAAFEAAHELPEPVVHGALTPASVLVSDDDAAPEVRVLDFGLGAAVDPIKAPKRSARAATCASPEQLAGAPLHIASDVFSLGLLLMEALAEPPDSGTTAALSLRYVGRLDTPDAVWTAVLQATRQKPAERFANAGAMRAALSIAWDTPDPVSEEPAPPEAASPPAPVAPRAAPPEAPRVAAPEASPASPVTPTPLGVSMPAVPVAGPMPTLVAEPTFDDAEDDSATYQMAVPQDIAAARAATSGNFARTMGMDEFERLQAAPSAAFAGTEVVDLDRRKLARMHSLSAVMTSHDIAVNAAPAQTVVGAPPPQALVRPPAAKPAARSSEGPPWRTLAAALIIVTALAGAVMLTWAMHLRRKAASRREAGPAPSVSVGLPDDGGARP